MSSQSKENVVIVGSGGAGARIANALSANLDKNKYNLLLVTSRPYYVHLVACLRMVVSSEEALEDRILIPLDKNFVNGNGSVVVGTVVSVKQSESGNGGHVVLDNGEAIEYSVLVLATGSTWEGPLNLPSTKAETKEWAHKWRKQFADAEDIVFVGGGAVGIEYAGEVKDLWPNKRVTIVHGDSSLLNSAYPEKWRKEAGRRVEERGVSILLNEYVDDLNTQDGEVRTRSGKSITADLVVPSRGGKPNTGSIATLGDDVLTSQGFVKVKPTLQLVNHPQIFAAGDIIDWKEQKQVGKCMGHSSVVAANVLSLLSDKPVQKMYKGTPEMIFICNGRTRGMAYLDILWGLSFGNWVTSLIKSKGLLIGFTRSGLGYKD
ncbi:hypothetical protein AX16_006264 [Volvariella volvacea WC 439]|nr:hypothetical protein AX16_006264 [Volvariella volvacea WC 439]